VVEKRQDSMWMYFMKVMSLSDVVIILTSKKGLFSSKVSYQLVMDLARRAFTKRAYTVIEIMLTEVEKETLGPSPIHRLMIDGSTSLQTLPEAESWDVELCLFEFLMCNMFRLP
jgi:hypothetical protein